MSSEIKKVDSLIPGGVDTGRLIESFFAGKSPRTVKAYRTDIADFCRFLEVDTANDAADVLFRDYTEASMLALDYKQHLIDRKLAPTTVNRRIASLRSFVGFAKNLGIIPWSLNVKGLKVTSQRDLRGPGVPGFSGMVAQAASHKGAKGTRDVAILRLLFDLGLRRGELTALDLSDVDIQGKTLQVIGKGKTQKIALTLPDRTAKALAEWIAKRGNAPGALFTSFDHAKKGSGRLTGHSVYRLIRGLGEKLGIKTRPHGIRHTSITEALKRAQAHGYDIEEVLQFSRHSNVAMLLVYRDKERDAQGSIAELVSGAV